MERTSPRLGNKSSRIPSSAKPTFMSLQYLVKSLRDHFVIDIFGKGHAALGGALHAATLKALQLASVMRILDFPTRVVFDLVSRPPRR